MVPCLQGGDDVVPRLQGGGYVVPCLQGGDDVVPHLQGGVMWCHVCREGLCGAMSAGRG